MKRKLALASVAVTALLVLTACGNGAVTENTTSGVGIPEVTVEPTTGDESIIANLPPAAAQILVSNMRVGDAVIAAENAGFEVRLVEVDGVSRPATMDYREDRLNFSVTNGVVVGVTQG